jgi:hypothetical protein
LLRQRYGLPLHQLSLYFIRYLRNEEKWGFLKLIVRYLRQRIHGRRTQKRNGTS